MAASASTGATLFSYHDYTPGSQFWGTASIAGGVLYLGNQDGKLFAFGS
jgi:hypothetical protein